MTILNSLRTCRIFENLDEAMLAKVAAIARTRQYADRETIFSEGDICSGFFLLTEGAVKVYKLSPEGKEHVLHLAWPGETFAEAALFLGGSYPAYAEAIKPTRAVFFPRDAFVQLMEQHPDISLRLLGGMAIWLRRLVSQVEVLALRDSASRLAQYLTDASEDGNVTLRTPKSVVASHLGMTPETLSRLFFKLESIGAIRVRGRSIAITDAGAMSRIAEGALEV